MDSRAPGKDSSPLAATLENHLHLDYCTSPSPAPSPHLGNDHDSQTPIPHPAFPAGHRTLRSNCIRDVSLWMSPGHLKVNAAKNQLFSISGNQLPSQGQAYSSSQLPTPGVRHWCH